MGCVGFDALLRNGFEVPAVLTHRDDPCEEVWWQSLGTRAIARGVPVHYLDSPKGPSARDLVASCAPDFLFSFYYRHLIPEEVLSLAPRGALNLHGSLLPKYRGRAPVNWVLVNGETETGVSLHHMVAKPDAGDLVDQEAVAIDFAETPLTLYAKLEGAAAKLLDRTLPLLKAGRAPRVPLDLSKGSYFGGRKPEDGLIRWDRPAEQIYFLVRGVTHPYPGAFTTLGGRKLFVWWAWPGGSEGAVFPGTVLGAAGAGFDVAACGGSLRVLRCQLEGEEETDGADFFTRHGLVAGERLGS
jgi:methionyl-tRNA formyltransferase